jgi:tRNA modification GTPase
MTPDFVSIDLRGALGSLGLISGETVTEDLIERIFRDFCIGK